MNALETQIQQLAQLAEESMPWIDPREIQNPSGIRELPPLTPVTGRTGPPVWVAFAVAAVVIAVLFVPLLFARSEAPPPPATESPVSTTSVAPTTLASTPTAITTPSTTVLSPPAADQGDWEFLGPLDDSLERPSGVPLGILDGDVVIARSGVRHVYDTESDPPRFLGTEPLDGDERAWLLRSSDGRTWERQHLSHFDGTWFRVAIEADLLWIEYWDAEVNDAALHRSTDGTDWEKVQFDSGDGATFTEPSPVSHYFPHTRGFEWTRTGDTILAPGRLQGELEDSVWLSDDAGRTFLRVDPFGTPHTEIQVGNLAEGFFALGVGVDQLTDPEFALDGPQTVTYSTAFSVDGIDWSPGRPLELPVPSGGLSSHCAPDVEPICIRRGPLSTGASVNYMTYPIDDHQPAANLNVIEVVALEARIVAGTVELVEIARSVPCGWSTEAGCIPNFTGFKGEFGPFRIAGGLAGYRYDGVSRIWITEDGVSWNELPIDGRGSVVAEVTVSFPGEDIYLVTEEGRWVYVG